MIKLLYKPMSMLVSVLGGIVAGAIFKKAWQVVAREDEAPKATDARRGWAEVLLAAAVAAFAAAQHRRAHSRSQEVPSWPVADQKQGRKPWPRRLAAGVGVVGGVPGTSHSTKGAS